MKHLNQNFEALIKYLHREDAYSFPINSPIVRLETHISEVFLAGDYAYKIKKPVDFGFLNFSTLKQREFYCHKEFNYNKVFSSELYLGVVPVVKIEEGKWIIDPVNSQNHEKKEIVEWAVKMRKLDPQSLFSYLLEQGRLQEKDIEGLGWKLSELHEKASKSPLKFNDSKTLSHIINEDTLQTKDFPESVLSKDDHQNLDHLFKVFLKDNQSLFEQRIKDGMIRECHGDLHLGNVAKFKGEIILFDCIEFNEKFRNIDVIYDVAFLAMDLYSKKEVELASVLISSYFNHRFDLGGAQLLNFYMALRAFIRGKVLYFQDKRQEAKEYFDCALDRLQKKGKLFLVSGLSGSGKTTVGKVISGKMGALHLRSDVLRKQIGGIQANEKGSKELYTKEMSKKTYTLLIEEGLRLCQFGLNVVIDAKFDKLEHLQNLFNQAREKRIPLKSLRCDAPKGILMERINNRRNDFSDATSDLIEDQLKRDEWTRFEYCKDFLVLDTSKDWEKELSRWLIV